MKMRTNFFNEISVTSRAGAKYFDMTREQLTNGEEETIKIEEMEVHRILFVE